MSTLIYMKILEQTPGKYDRGMRILTFGRIDRIKQEIALTQIEAGHEILEIGCGTGTLAAMMTARGAHVVGIDISESMLAAARRKFYSHDGNGDQRVRRRALQQDRCNALLQRAYGR